MLTIWIIAIGMALVVAGSIAARLLRGGRAATGDADMALYRAQLAEIDRDMARRVVSDAEAAELRLEVSRRLLAADRRIERTPDFPRAGTGRSKVGMWLPAVIVTVAMPAGAALLYARLGAPDLPDLPRAERIARAEEFRRGRDGQAAIEARLQARNAGLSTLPDPVPAETRRLVEELRGVVANRPDDIRGQAFLAQGEASIGDFAAAHRAQSRVIDLKGPASTAEDYGRLADYLIRAAQGIVSPEAEVALGAVLARDPKNGAARFYIGLTAAQTGRPDVAFRYWRDLLADSGPDSPWYDTLRANLPLLAQAAGVDYDLPDPPRGPTQADIAAAADMDPAARTEMIRTMVAGLADRLATEGGPASDWARLIRAYGTLGQNTQAAEIWNEARTLFAEDQLAEIRSAARAAGVAGAGE